MYTWYPYMSERAKNVTKREKEKEWGDERGLAASAARGALAPRGDDNRLSRILVKL
jgi:hypothetical protein